MAAKAKKISAEKKVDPFKTRKTKAPGPKTAEPLVVPPEIMEAIDQFRECQEQAKHYEGEASVYKDTILDFCQEKFCARALKGDNESFKLLGGDSMVHYVVQDSSAGLAEEDLATIEERWGEKAAEELVVRDYASLKFDPKVLEAHYDEVVAALQTLPENVLEGLFRPMLLKAAPKALDKAVKYCKSPEDLRELMAQLKLKNYIK